MVKNSQYKKDQATAVDHQTSRKKIRQPNNISHRKVVVSYLSTGNRFKLINETGSILRTPHQFSFFYISTSFSNCLLRKQEVGKNIRLLLSILKHTKYKLFSHFALYSRQFMHLSNAIWKLFPLFAGNAKFLCDINEL
jgi:hypothetical protein